MSLKPAGESTTPAHVVLAVVLQVREGRLCGLLWERAREPFAGRWSLPGGELARAVGGEHGVANGGDYHGQAGEARPRNTLWQILTCRCG